MSEKRVVRQYEVEFKLDAVRLVEQQGVKRPRGSTAAGHPEVEPVELV